ncbi:MAG: bifunctional phosphoribosyl-AMP cyclohydrolase/phosphoribosyl-ATP diphosphatase HisIE [Deltaproteobacteria bacterium]|nr:bifunctional phosphoribosyl-AMP cyclohydrolase/phosphoribosyl-ATP diphosphatase HisIE [Deltaproteobacteria bacterium]
MGKISINPDTIKFNGNGLVPAIAQEAETGEVLMLAYMDRDALEKTLSTGKAHYYSRSREKLWLKGETSGNFQDVSSIYYDCDADAILLKVKQTGPACHTGERTCFFRRLTGGKTKAPAGPFVLTGLFRTILERKKSAPEESYVSSLYSKGEEGILKKIREESAELIEAARGKGKKEIVHELCDLWFHTLVLLGFKDMAVEDVFTELSRRSGTSGIEEKKSRNKHKE